jgi:hypothetical protein
MKRITIKGAFADEISWIEHHTEYTTPSTQLTHYEVIADNNTSKEKMADLFKNCLSFDLVSNADEDGYDDGAEILFIFKKTQEEIDKVNEKFEADRLHHIDCCISRLRKWSDDKVEDKEQIETYLKHKKLDWILEKIKIKEIK